MKKGISLIVLVITIIVIVILAGAVIISLSTNNPISRSEEATFKSDLNYYKSELAINITNKYANDPAFDPNNWNVTDPVEVKKVISVMAERDIPNFHILKSKLTYIGSNPNEIQWCEDAGISVLE